MPKNQFLSDSALRTANEIKDRLSDCVNLDTRYGRLLQLCATAAQCTQFTGDGSARHLQKAQLRDGLDQVGILAESRSALWEDFNNLLLTRSKFLDVSVTEDLFFNVIRDFLEVPRVRTLRWKFHELGFRGESYPFPVELCERLQELRAEMEVLCHFCIEQADYEYRELSERLRATPSIPTRQAQVAALADVWEAAIAGTSGALPWLTEKELERASNEVYDTMISRMSAKMPAGPEEEDPSGQGYDPLPALQEIPDAERAKRKQRFETLVKVVPMLSAFEHRHGHLAYLSNCMAREVLGWHVKAADPRKLWRNPDGTPVSIVLPSGTRYAICQHPWLSEVNEDRDISYSPAHNYHCKEVDWMEWTRQAIAPPANPR